MVPDRKEHDGEGGRGPIPTAETDNRLLRHSPLLLRRIAAVVVMGRVPDDAAAAAATAALPLLVVPSAAARRRAAAPRRHGNEDDEKEEDAGGAADVDREVLLCDLPRAHAQRERRVGRRRGGGRDGGRRRGRRRCRRGGHQGRRGGELEGRRDIITTQPSGGDRGQIIISEERETKVTPARAPGPAFAFLAGGRENRWSETSESS